VLFFVHVVIDDRYDGRIGRGEWGRERVVVHGWRGVVRARPRRTGARLAHLPGPRARVRTGSPGGGAGPRARPGTVAPRAAWARGTTQARSRTRGYRDRPPRSRARPSNLVRSHLRLRPGSQTSFRAETRRVRWAGAAVTSLRMTSGRQMEGQGLWGGVWSTESRVR
jgi:hypothetical protein